MKAKEKDTKQNRYGALLVQEIHNPTNTEIHVGADISFWVLKEALNIYPAIPNRLPLLNFQNFLQNKEKYICSTNTPKTTKGRDPNRNTRLSPFTSWKGVPPFHPSPNNTVQFPWLQIVESGILGCFCVHDRFMTSWLNAIQDKRNLPMKRAYWASV